MTTPTGPLRRFARAAASMAAVILVTACGRAPRGPPAAAGATATATAHAASHTSSPIAAAQPLRAGERFLDLPCRGPTRPSPPNGGTDEYRCFLLDPQLTKPTFLTGSQFLPQNRRRRAPRDPVPDPGRGRGERPAPRTPRPPARAGPASAAPACDGRAATPALGRRLGAGRQRDRCCSTTSATAAARAARSSCRCTTTCSPPAAAAPAPTSRPSGCGWPRHGGHQAAATTMLLPAPVELPCAAGESGPLCDRDRGHRRRDPALRRRGGGTGGELSAPAAAAPPVPGNTQHCDIRYRVAHHDVRGAGHMHLLGRSIKVELNPGTAAGADAARRPGLRLRQPGRQAAADPGRRSTRRHGAGHLHPRRHAAPAAAGAERPPAAVRGVGRGHQRRDVPRAVDRHDRQRARTSGRCSAQPHALEDRICLCRSGPLRREPMLQSPARNSFPGRRMVEGKLGWFGESGKCWVSRQKPSCLM